RHRRPRRRAGGARGPTRSARGSPDAAVEGGGTTESSRDAHPPRLMIPSLPMRYQDLSPVELQTSLRAAKAVALADGVFSARERALLGAAVEALALGVDVDAIEPITPEQAAAALHDQAARTRLIQAQIIMAMMDGDITESELSVIWAFSAALGVEEP